MTEGKETIQISDLDIEIRLRSGSMKIKDLRHLLELMLFKVTDEETLESYTTMIESRNLVKGSKNLNFINSSFHID